MSLNTFTVLVLLWCVCEINLSDSDITNGLDVLWLIDDEVLLCNYVLIWRLPFPDYYLTRFIIINIGYVSVCLLESLLQIYS